MFRFLTYTLGLHLLVMFNMFNTSVYDNTNYMGTESIWGSFGEMVSGRLCKVTAWPGRIIKVKRIWGTTGWCLHGKWPRKHTEFFCVAYVIDEKICVWPQQSSVMRQEDEERKIWLLMCH